MRHVVSGVRSWWRANHLARRATERARRRRSVAMLERNVIPLRQRGGNLDLFCVQKAEKILQQVLRRRAA